MKCVKIMIVIDVTKPTFLLDQFVSIYPISKDVLVVSTVQGPLLSTVHRYTSFYL